jgi:hypothetical protein
MLPTYRCLAPLCKYVDFDAAEFVFAESIT